MLGNNKACMCKMSKSFDYILVHVITQNSSRAPNYNQYLILFAASQVIWNFFLIHILIQAHNILPPIYPLNVVTKASACDEWRWKCTLPFEQSIYPSSCILCNSLFRLYSHPLVLLQGKVQMPHAMIKNDCIFLVQAEKDIL